MNKFSSASLLFFGFLLCGAHPVKAQAKNDRSQIESLSFIRRVLDDNMLPSSFRGAKVEFQSEEPELGSLRFKIIKQNLLNYNTYDWASVKLYPNGKFDFMLFLENEDAIELKSPNWEMLIPKIDAFVQRYWVGLRRTTDWKDAITHYNSRGVFSIEYVQTQQGVPLQYVGLEIRLTDGKIGGLNYMNNHHLLSNTTITPSPTNEKLLTAISIALEKQGYSISNLLILKTERNIDIDLDKGQQILRGFTHQLELQGESAKEKVIINAWFDEKSQKAEINNITPFHPNTHHPTVVQKPFTTIEDEKPRWVGKDLFFITTRDVEGRLWWQRDFVVRSMAVSKNGSNNSMSLIRPVKPLSHDLRSYVMAQPHREGARIISTLSESQKQMFLLDLNKGIISLPNREGSQQNYIVNLLPSISRDAFRWNIDSAAWVDSDVIIALYKDHDLNLYLARQTSIDLTIRLIPLVIAIGDDTLPNLSSDNKRLLWVRKLQEQERTSEIKWKIYLGEFNLGKVVTEISKANRTSTDLLEDLSKVNVTNHKSLELPAKPVSISYDSKGDRWIIILETGEMLWIKEAEGKLTSSKAGTIKWGEIGLKPTSADVSPDGSKIAVAAELDKPQVYEKTECVVHSLIFIWDGKSEQVKPAYEPSLNGIPRYTFPNGSPWAKIVGDVKKFGLEGVADPAYFVTPPAPVKPPQ